MKTPKTNIGLIHFGPAGRMFKLYSINMLNGFYLKKILLPGDVNADTAKSYYPNAEIVHNMHSITNDSSIDLVIIAGSPKVNAELLTEVLQSGKNLRII